MAKGSKPAVVIISGPNGAGKSTIAPRVLRGALEVTEFVNADVIARGLSAFEPEKVAISAGRIMLQRLRELADSRASFAFETTLASRSFAPWIAKLRQQGYLFHLIYLWLPSPDLAIKRVATRVRMGGHYVPDETVVRRHAGGLRNFFELYRPIADTWRCYDSTVRPKPRTVASGKGVHHERIYNKETWQSIVQAYRQSDPAA
jgi:predicted ABC-type ATPase